MKILRKFNDQNLSIDNFTDFKTNLGWEENFQEIEDQTLLSIINPVDNYETTRYIHKPYTSTITSLSQTDLWFYFRFLDSLDTYNKGLDYELVGITNQQNAMMLKQSTKSFFRLEFYSTPNRENQKLIFAKNLSLPLGEKVFHNTLYEYIHLPVFTGNNYRNTENMYLFWFIEDTVFSGTTFYMTARFFNAEDGSIIPFTNKIKSRGDVIDQIKDLYYAVTIDRADHSYQITKYDGLSTTRVGQTSTPINFFEMRTDILTFVPQTRTPTPTPTPTATYVSSIYPTFTPTPTVSSSSQHKLKISIVGTPDAPFFYVYLNTALSTSFVINEVHFYGYTDTNCYFQNGEGNYITPITIPGVVGGTQFSMTSSSGLSESVIKYTVYGLKINGTYVTDQSQIVLGGVNLLVDLSACSNTPWGNITPTPTPTLTLTRTPLPTNTPTISASAGAVLPTPTATYVQTTQTPTVTQAIIVPTPTPTTSQAPSTMLYDIEIAEGTEGVMGTACSNWQNANSFTVFHASNTGVLIDGETVYQNIGGQIFNGHNHYYSDGTSYGRIDLTGYYSKVANCSPI
jgi:hypothetical protein